MFCRKCGREMNDSDMFCPACGTPVFENAGDDIFPPMTLPMKWYKFLIYFSLWAAMATSGFAVGYNAIFIINHIGEYLNSPIALAFDLSYTLFSAAYCVLAFVTRTSLVKFQRKAPVLLYFCYGLNAATSLIYEIGTYVMTGTFTEGYLGISTLIATAVIIVANYVYFTKRKHLFMN